ncbi:MAG: efflux RND transporter periplasmic adaptor subunit [Gammaproteobacteria bacterium]|nr:efflux RND transporter periplasmic adaptor subunit [Gammaproteobacteria bacterium]MCP4091715.1 efflux RND transporter periplasmic adaptor subunit [Gammaproteobacteria bacterium]MCP4275022.1 efflux RND transporter periplasmic adaptor subunit [Gammaproteobacteria bacterium]MCP4831845.1 efflux RND transporter periplasmic adaptor subunit [Gammaproteobacteria bacterium]MCP4929781.1 efflux RND transporter periplasmic adaptor subunit [Gammaproteobacteria bacterium]
MRILLFLVLPSLMLVILSGCDFGGKPPVPPPVSVQVIKAETEDFPLIIDLVGSTLGNQDVPIRARVDGFLETINFIEGQQVEKGRLLYTIDSQSFQQELVEAQSQLAAAETLSAKNASDLRRIQPLAEINAVSQMDLDSAVANDAASRASVKAAQAGVELANIELSYTEIYAPISGLIGLTKAKPGEYVGKEPNPVVLNTLSDIDPIRVQFSISEREYLILARGFNAEKRNAAGYEGDSAAEAGVTKSNQRKSNIPLSLILADGSEWPEKGYADATSQAIDPRTGTFKIEAVFPNSRGLLRPGQFARVRASYQVLKDVVVIPKQALAELQGIYQVYVVDSDNTVKIINVEKGPSRGGNIVITKGLKSGQTIIVEGLQKVRAGMTVATEPFQAVALNKNKDS